MKKIVALFSLLLFGTSFSQNYLQIDSKVSSAAIFRDRALVERRAECSLGTGTFTLVFPNLTTDLLDASVRVMAIGTGEIKILEVKVERRFNSDIRNKTFKSLQTKADSLDVQRQISQDRIAVLEKKKSFIESLNVSSAEQAGNTMLMEKPSINTWSEILQFVDTNLSGVYHELRTENRRMAELEQQITTLQKKMNRVHSLSSRDYKEIIVMVETKRAGEFTVSPSYIVKQAGWQPTFDARVFTDSDVMQLSYFGMIHQATGEDWIDVKLTLSTVDPIAPGSLPVLRRWFVDTKPLPRRRQAAAKRRAPSQSGVRYETNWGLAQGEGAIAGYVTDKETAEPLPGANVVLEGKNLGSTADAAGRYFISNVPKGNYSLRVALIGYAPMRKRIKVEEKYIANLDIALQQQDIQGEKIKVRAQGAKIMMDRTSIVRIESSSVMEAASSPSYMSVQTKELSTVFEIPTPYSIPSDNSQHKVTIAIEALPIELSYAAFPAKSQGVFLKGKITNTKEYPLLAGDISVFVDDDFVNKDALETVVASDTLTLALGLDDRIQVKRVLLNKFTESKGLLRGVIKTTYEYEIRAENHHAAPKKVFVHESIPISMNKEIKIELLKPTPEFVNQDNQITWELELQPGEQKILPVVYTVEYPGDKRVYGLE